MTETPPLDLTPIRARLERFDPAYNSQRRDVAALVAEVDHLRAELARERQHSADLRSALTALRDQWRSTRHQHPEDRLIDAVLVDCAADLDACLNAGQEGS